MKKLFITICLAVTAVLALQAETYSGMPVANAEVKGVKVGKANVTAEFETGIFYRFLERVIIHVVFVMPLHAQFLACDIGFGKHYVV